jgi:hypothetical protein
MLDMDPEPEMKAECITVPSQPWQKVAVIAIPAPQHCFYGLRAAHVYGALCNHNDLLRIRFRLRKVSVSIPDPDNNKKIW